MKTLYHGSHREIIPQPGRCMYFTPELDVAKQYALGLDDLGNYNPESFIYSIEIDENSVVKEEDALHFDCIGYQNYKGMPEICYNPDFDYFCIKNVPKLKLVESYKNEL